MPTIAASPFVLRDVDLKIGASAGVGDNYEGHVSTVRFDPSAPTVSWQAMTPAGAYSAQGTTTWTLTISGAQDWATVNSLTSYLLANDGTEKVVVFMPRKGSGQKTFTATVTLAAPPIGGDVNTVAQFTVTLGVKGAPVPGVSA